MQSQARQTARPKLCGPPKVAPWNLRVFPSPLRGTFGDMKGRQRALQTWIGAWGTVSLLWSVSGQVQKRVTAQNTWCKLRIPLHSVLPTPARWVLLSFAPASREQAEPTRPAAPVHARDARGAWDAPAPIPLLHLVKPRAESHPPAPPWVLRPPRGAVSWRFSLLIPLPAAEFCHVQDTERALLDRADGRELGRGMGMDRRDRL